MWHKNGLLFILTGDWVVADTSLPIINKLYIYGVLELEYQINPETEDYFNFILNCSHIIISGGRLIVGWEDQPFMGQASIVLRGDHYSPDMPLPDGPNMGAKALGKSFLSFYIFIVFLCHHIHTLPDLFSNLVFINLIFINLILLAPILGVFCL